MSEFLDLNGLDRYTKKVSDLFKKPNKITIELQSNEWQDNRISITSAYALTDPKYIYLIASSPDTLDEYNTSNIKMLDVDEDGLFVFECRNVPSLNIFVNILRLEVSPNEDSKSV